MKKGGRFHDHKCHHESAAPTPEVPRIPDEAPPLADYDENEPFLAHRTRGRGNRISKQDPRDKAREAVEEYLDQSGAPRLFERQSRGDL
jgi:hypothetical protein